MSNLPRAPPDALQGGEGSWSSADIKTERTKKRKLSARDLLRALARKRIYITEIEFASNSSQDGGTYADVAVATLVRADGDEEDRRTVAVKKLRFVLNDGMTEEMFLRVFVNELRVLDKLSHPNIVEIIGFVEDIDNRIAWLVFPWEDNGNLREFLRSGKWELPERVSLIKDVAHGLEYLHTRQPPICHGDLKSLNILVNSEYRALITDFGSARVAREFENLETNPAHPTVASGSRVPPKDNGLIQLNLTTSDTKLTLTGPQWSIRWAPPDVLKGGSLNLASDIWALGWIAWEAITDSHPFEELDVEWDVMTRILEGQLPSLHDHVQLSEIRRLRSMMLRCWKSEPNERLPAIECCKILHWIASVVPALKDGEQPTISAPTWVKIAIGSLDNATIERVDSLVSLISDLRERFLPQQTGLRALSRGPAQGRDLGRNSVHSEAWVVSTPDRPPLLRSPPPAYPTHHLIGDCDDEAWVASTPVPLPPEYSTIDYHL